MAMPNKLAQKQEGTDSGKWANLSPRQQQKLKQLMEQKLGSHRAGLVKDYHRKMAETDNE